jgi:hypothetical protein
MGSVEKLDELRVGLTQIPNIDGKRLRVHNQLTLQGHYYQITDFSIEVDQSVEKEVRDVVRKADFEFRGTPLLDLPGTREAVESMVKQHAKENRETQLKYAVWFRLEDPHAIHLLEIEEGAFDPGDGSLQGIAMAAGSTVPEARKIVIYLASPQEFRKALVVNPDHAAVQAVREHSEKAILVYPSESEENWRQLLAEFGIQDLRA